MVDFLKTTCGQGARKSAAKTALFRAPLALTVSIDLSASDDEHYKFKVYLICVAKLFRIFFMNEIVNLFRAQKIGVAKLFRIFINEIVN